MAGAWHASPSKSSSSSTSHATESHMNGGSSVMQHANATTSGLTNDSIVSVKKASIENWSKDKKLDKLAQYTACHVSLSLTLSYLPGLQLTLGLAVTRSTRANATATKSSRMMRFQRLIATKGAKTATTIKVIGAKTRRQFPQVLGMIKSCLNIFRGSHAALCLDERSRD